MIELTYKRLSNELIEILGDYIYTYNSLQEYFDKYKSRKIELTQKTIRLLRFNNYMECYLKGKKVLAQLVCISSNMLCFTLPEEYGKLKTDDKLNCKMYFQLYRFMVTGKISEIIHIGDKVEITIDIVFSPELIEIMDDYFYRIENAIE